MVRTISASMLAGQDIRLHKEIRTVISIMVAVCTVLMLVYLDSPKKIYLLLMLLIYYVLFINIAQIDKLYYQPGMFLVNLTCIFRYVLIPLFYVLDLSYSFTSDLTAGVYLMLYEEVCVGIFLYILVNKSYKVNAPTQLDRLSDSMTSELTTQIGVMLLAMVAAAGVIVAMDPSYLNEYNFVLGVQESDIIRNYGSIQTAIIEWSKMIIPLLIASFLIKRNQKHPNFIYYFLTVCVVLLFNLMFFKGFSRNSAIVPGAASMFFLIRAFPRQSKTTLIMVSVMIVIVALALTTFKNSTAHWEVDSIAASRDYLNAYFAGVDNLSDSISAYKNYKSSFSLNTLLNDLFYNVPGLSRYFDGEDRTTVLFNSWIGTKSSIVPAIGQGLFYFGTVLSVIPELIFLWIMSVFDNKMRNAVNIAEVFFYSYFAIEFGYIYYQNISLLFSFLLGTAIPLIVLLKLFSKFRLRVNGRLLTVSMGDRNL